MRRGFKTWAERKSAEMRAALRLPGHSSLSAMLLAQHLELIVIDPAQLTGISSTVPHELLVTSSECWSAVTIPTEAGTIIVHNTRHAPTRQESNLMHEIAHVICEHRGATVQCSGKLPWATRTYDEDEREEAIWLGGCLQIPRTGLMWALNREMENQAIAAHFGASEALGADSREYDWRRYSA